MTLTRSLALIALAGAAAGGAWWMRAHRARPAEPVASRVSAPVPDYVGSTACRDCHAAAYAAWNTSDHRHAMQTAVPGAVLGNFDNGRFTRGGVTSTFFRRDGKFWTRTDGPEGSLEDFAVKYTFGISPLQQYLIEFPDGRVQALSIAWDTRPKGAGGQRWFHLYPRETIAHTDELHWTGPQQNWNFMCADCHSTNLRKGYDAAANRFQSTWSEIDVGCEGCHGPGSRHVAWARSPASQRTAENALAVHLRERNGVRWTIDPGTQQPLRSEPRKTHVEIDVCAQCHSRRAQIAEGYTAGAPLEDYYAPESIAADLYYADGQQRDEVYTYASFLQSRMAAAGVTCSDCHEPHGGTLRAGGNALCTQCHVAAKYDAVTHHFHPSGPGAQCVSCHMPATVYMGVDARRDHNFSVPRPDRSMRMNVPNACTGCHRDRGAAWADQQIRARTGRQPAGFQTFAEAFDAAAKNKPGAADALRAVADDASRPAIVRASAVARLAAFPSRAAVDVAARAVNDPEPSVRRAGLMVLENLPPEARVTPAAPLLDDPVRSVRLEAAWLLAPAANIIKGSSTEPAFSRAAGEFIASRRYRADRAEDRTTLGMFNAQTGRLDEAAAEYRAAIRLSPGYTPAYVNLADLQREQGHESDAEKTLRDGLARLPADAILHHALGLSLVRSGRRSEAMAELRRATELSDAARFAYAYAIALQDAGRTAEALRYAERVLAAHPDDDETRALVASLRKSR
jgi:predicted CXXCH cytochrome family protein